MSRLQLLWGPLAKTATVEPRSCLAKTHLDSDTVCRISIAGPTLTVGMHVRKVPVRCGLVQAGAGVRAGFEARTARLFSFCAFSLSICSLAALVTRGFLPAAFAPSLGFAVALTVLLAAPPRPLPVARPRFGKPSALQKVNTRSTDCKKVARTAQPGALVPEEPKDHCTRRIRPY